MLLQASDIIDRIRVHLDQIPLTNEDVRTDSAIIGSLSTNFSDADLLERILDAQRDIVTKVKAQHVPLAVIRYDTAEGKTLPVIDEEIVRLLYSRIFYTGEDGDPNITAPYDPAGYFAGTPSTNEIMYQLIAGRVITVTDIIVTTDTDPTTTQSLVITVDGTTVGSIALNTSGTHVTTIGGGSFEVNTGSVMRIIAGSGIDAEDFNFAFEATAEVFSADTVEGIRATQRTVDRNRRLQASGRAATGSYPVYTYEDGELNVYPNADDVLAFLVIAPPFIATSSLYNGNDFLTLDSRFEAAIIYWVLASCYETTREVERQQFAYSIFQDEIEPYGLFNRFNSLIDDREVDIE
jgi:hypothetical protein